MKLICNECFEQIYLKEHPKAYDFIKGRAIKCRKCDGELVPLNLTEEA